MKKKSALAVLALTFGLVACGLDDSSDEFSCEVTRRSTFVKIEERLSGFASYVSTVTAEVDRYGDDYVNIETEMWYSKSSMAQQECSNMKSKAGSWRDGSMRVECSGNYVVVYEYDEGSLDNHELSFEKMCREGRRRYEKGEFDQYL